MSPDWDLNFGTHAISSSSTRGLAPTAAVQCRPHASFHPIEYEGVAELSLQRSANVRAAMDTVPRGDLRGILIYIRTPTAPLIFKYDLINDIEPLWGGQTNWILPLSSPRQSRLELTYVCTAVGATFPACIPGRSGCT